jgi:asparagine N-glycosylation enzyme membrane subunit Stt3
MKNKNKYSIFRPWNNIEKLLAILVLIGILLRLILLSQEPTTIQNYQTDDSYFYYSMARNIIGGNGVVLNEGIPTNGFHPLYLVMLVPIFYMFYPLGVDVPIYITLGVLSVLNVVTAIILFLTVKKIYNEYAGILSSAIWILNPHIMSIYLSGMEVGLQVFFLSVLSAKLNRGMST